MASMSRSTVAGSGPVGDLLHGGLAHPLLLEQLERGPVDLLLGVHPAPGAQILGVVVVHVVLLTFRGSVWGRTPVDVTYAKLAHCVII